MSSRQRDGRQVSVLSLLVVQREAPSVRYRTAVGSRRERVPSAVLSSDNSEVRQDSFCKVKHRLVHRRITRLRCRRIRRHDAERAVDNLILRPVRSQFRTLHGLIPRGNVTVAGMGQPHLLYDWAIIICAPDLVLLPNAILVSRSDPAGVFGTRVAKLFAKPDSPTCSNGC